jgi:hypothetical protein
VDAMMLSLLISLSCQQFSDDMLYPLSVYSNSRGSGPAIEIPARVLGEDIRWLCEVQPNQTLGWALELIHRADCLTQAEDGYAVRYQY